MSYKCVKNQLFKPTLCEIVPDPRIAMVRSNPSLGRALLAVLLEVYWSSAGPAVRSQALKAILRCVYYADATLLRVVLKMQVHRFGYKVLNKVYI